MSNVEINFGVFRFCIRLMLKLTNLISHKGL